MTPGKAHYKIKKEASGMYVLYKRTRNFLGWVSWRYMTHARQKLEVEYAMFDDAEQPKYYDEKGNKLRVARRTRLSRP